MALKLVSICYAVIILVGCSNKQYEMYKSPCANLENLQKDFNA
ncbi:hypothetical protein [Helicobacter pylori]|nr:hypothetical protein [Helicobacter pylori]